MENNDTKKSATTTAAKKKSTPPKMTFNQKVELIQLEIDELRLKTEQVAELRNLLSQTVEEEEESVLSNNEFQKRIHIFDEKERESIKKKIFYLIEKYFN
jgi:hypothetical protein